MLSLVVAICADRCVVVGFSVHVVVAVAATVGIVTRLVMEAHTVVGKYFVASLGGIKCAAIRA